MTLLANTNSTRWLATSAALALCACAEAGPDATLTTDEQAVLWWHDHFEIAVSDDPYRGAPAWADDDRDAAGIELHYQRKLSVPPLQGWWDKRNFSFRPFIQDPDGGSKQFLTTGRLEGQPITLDYMRSDGYVLITRFLADAGTIDVVRVGLDGAVLTAASTPIGADRQVVPSPDGGVIADVRCQSWSETGDGAGGIVVEPLDPARCTVALLDGATLTTVGPTRAGTLAWPEPGQPPLVTAQWTPAGRLIVHAQTSAFALVLMGAATAVPVPACQGPQTTSSKVASDGRRVGVSWGKLRVVAADPDANDTFGCP
jgi:hypothetical protein